MVRVWHVLWELSFETLEALVLGPSDFVPKLSQRETAE
jgi:hypothetical protein